MLSGYDSLDASFTEYLYSEAKLFISNVHYDSYYYLDKDKKRMRSKDGITALDHAVKYICSDHASKMVSYLKRENVLDINDVQEKTVILNKTCNEYLNGLKKEIDKKMSELA